MADLTPQNMAGKLLAEGFARNGPDAAALTDPIADTPMVVTLDQLRPYDHNPRVTRNPLYDEIKASIRERGLDAPPAITRRPGERAYIIRNGGNTRLAILRERLNYRFSAIADRGPAVSVGCQSADHLPFARRRPRVAIHGDVFTTGAHPESTRPQDLQSPAGHSPR